MSDNSLSAAFYAALKKLKKMRSTGAITEAEWKQEVEKIKLEEIQRNEPLNKMVLAHDIETAISDIESEFISEQEQERKLIEESLEQQHLEKVRKRATYREDVEKKVANLEREIKFRSRVYRWLQRVALGLTGLTSVFAVIDFMPRWVTTFAGVAAVFCTSLAASEKMQSVIYRQRISVAKMKTVLNNYDWGLGNYSGLDYQQKYQELRKDVAQLLEVQWMQEADIWKPETKEKDDWQQPPAPSEKKPE